MNMNWITVLLLTAAVNFLSGCATSSIGGAGAAGVGPMTDATGDLKSIEDVPLNRAWQAAQGACKDLGIVVEDQMKNDLQARLIGRDSGGKRVQIDLMAFKEAVTDIRIRVGSFGDETVSREILARIRKNY